MTYASQRSSQSPSLYLESTSNHTVLVSEEPSALVTSMLQDTPLTGLYSTAPSPLALISMLRGPGLLYRTGLRMCTMPFMVASERPSD